METENLNQTNCLCDYEFGLKGRHCDGLSFLSRVIWAASILNLLAIFIGVALSGFIVYNWNKLYKQKLFPSKYLSVVFFLAIFCLSTDLVRTLAAFATLLNPRRLSVAELIYFGSMYQICTSSLGNGAFVLLNITLYLNLAMMIVIMWFWSNVIGISNLLLSEQSKSRLLHGKKKILIISALLMVLFLLGLCMNRLILSNLSGMSFAILVYYSCSYVGKLFVNVLQSLRIRTNLVCIVRRVSFRFRCASLLLFLGFLFSPISILMDRDVNLLRLLEELIILAKNINLIYTLRFINKIFANLERNSLHLYAR